MTRDTVSDDTVSKLCSSAARSIRFSKEPVGEGSLRLAYGVKTLKQMRSVLAGRPLLTRRVTNRRVTSQL